VNSKGFYIHGSPLILLLPNRLSIFSNPLALKQALMVPRSIYNTTILEYTWKSLETYNKSINMAIGGGGGEEGKGIKAMLFRFGYVF
jgi:hypothetical protein